MKNAPMKIYDQSALDNPTPPELRAFIGRRVTDAWVLPAGTCLVLRFEGGTICEVEAVPAVGGIALSIKAGEEQPGTSWAFLNSAAGKVHALKGMKFDGFDCNVMAFKNDAGEVFGAMMKPDGIRWVRERQG